MYDDRIPELSTSAAARRAGISNEVLERRERHGTFVRIRQGAYAAREQWQQLLPQTQHLALVAAAQSAARARIVFSHESAAAILAVPLLGAWPSRPHATASPLTPRRSTNAVIWSNAELEGDVVERDGFLVTSPIRTMIDLLSSRPFDSGVVSLDHVLSQLSVYDVDTQTLLAEVERRRPFRNADRVRRVVAFAAGISQSPFESLSMVRLWEGGYALPVQQKRFDIDGRTYFADFHFEPEDVAAEADGQAKYTDASFLRGRTPARALMDEKDREDAIRTRVRGFIRWSWDDAFRGAPLYRKLERAGIRPIRTRRPSLPST